MSQLTFLMIFALVSFGIYIVSIAFIQVSIIRNFEKVLINTSRHSKIINIETPSKETV